MSETITVLSVRQPWATLIVRGLKPIENRSWYTKYRGRLYIHASKKLSRADFQYVQMQHGIELDHRAVPVGGIIGYADLVSVCNHSDSAWFNGPFGWVLSDATEIPLIAMHGQLGLFRIPKPQ